MKNLIFYSLMLCFITTAQAQVTELEETTVFVRETSENSTDIDDLNLMITEDYIGEFEEDPLTFMKNNFDARKFIAQLNQEYNSYLISFKSRKGYLNAEFNKNGEIQENELYFRNIEIPRNLMKTLYRDHKGWIMIKNKYVASGEGDGIDRGFYKIKLKQGNRSKNLKFDLVSIPASGLVSN